MSAVNLKDLNDEQLELVRRFVNLLRESETTEKARVELQALWDSLVAAAPSIAATEVEALAEQAVAFARGQE